MIDQDGGRCDQADGFELVRVVETASVYRDGGRLGVVGVDRGELVAVEGGLDVFAVPELVAERIAREHRPRTFAASVTGGDGVFWEWFYS